MPTTPDPDYRQRLRRYYRRRRLLAAASIASALLVAKLVSCSGGTQTTVPETDDYPRYHGRTVRCVKVVDGDTIDVEIPDLKARQHQAYTRVRFWGIDTPELPRHGRPAMYFAYEATEFARNRMQGKNVRLELIDGDTRDYYGRLLAYVHLPDDALYNREAITTGCAYADPRYKHPRRDEFLQLEADARSNLTGLWAAVRPDQLPKWYRVGTLKQFWMDREARRTTEPSLSRPHQPE